MALLEINNDDVVALALFIAATAALVLRIFAWNQFKSMLAHGWLMQQGTVELGSVEEHRARYFSYYIARIDYSYNVNGEYYSGHFERTFLRESSADRFVAAMKGQMVFVRSNPRKPERSALLRNDQPAGWPA